MTRVPRSSLGLHCKLTKRNTREQGVYGLMIGFYDAHLMGATSVSKESLGPKNSYLKLPVPVFDFILKRITPIVEKQETHLRQTISPGARLEATLLFLITGDYYSRLQHLTRIHETTLGRFIPEICEAIYTELGNEYLKTPTTAGEWYPFPIWAIAESKQRMDNIPPLHQAIHYP